MSENEIKHEECGADGVMRPDGYGLPAKEAKMDDRAAEFVFQIFREQDAEGNPPAAVRQWTAFLSACKTEWELNLSGDTENPDPAIHVVNARMIHAGMDIHIQDIWMDVQVKYTEERGEYLSRFSGRLNNPFFGFDTEHPTLLVGPIPSGNDPLEEILKQADDYLYSFRWLEGTRFSAIPCIDRNGSLLICDLKNMDAADTERTNAALIEARDSSK